MDPSTTNLIVAIGAVLAALTGPVVAVLITLKWEQVRRSREAKQTVLRTLLTTRGRYADPSYSWAITATPLEFAKSPRVVAAHDAYLNSVRHEPTPENAERHGREGGRREAILISEMLKDLGYRGLSAEQIEAYTARGLVLREELFTRALWAMIQVGESSQRSAAAAEEMLKRMQPAEEEK